MYDAVASATVKCAVARPQLKEPAHLVGGLAFGEAGEDQEAASHVSPPRLSPRHPDVPGRRGAGGATRKERQQHGRAAQGADGGLRAAQRPPVRAAARDCGVPPAVHVQSLQTTESSL